MTFLKPSGFSGPQLSHGGNKAPMYHVILAFPRSGAKETEEKRFRREDSGTKIPRFRIQLIGRSARRHVYD